ncbi:AbiTii domain-containing protein [Nocardia sp. NPDC001965]
MSQIQEVIDLAQENGPVRDLLRKLKVVAFRAGAKDMLEWIEHELRGYPHGTLLPVYRGQIEVSPRREYSAGGDSRVVALKLEEVPEASRGEWYFTRAFRESVADLEEYAKKAQTRFFWPLEGEPDDVRAAYETRTYRTGRASSVGGMHLGSLRERETPGRTYYYVSGRKFSQILDTIRDRVLDLALEIEERVPNAGDATASEDDARAIAGVVNFHFNGVDFSDSNNAFGSGGFDQGH